MSQHACKKLIPYSLLAATFAMIGIFSYLVAWPWAFERWRLRPAIANLTDDAGDFQNDAHDQLQAMGPEIALEVVQMIEYEEESEKFRKNVARALAMLLKPTDGAEPMTRVVPVLTRVFKDSSRPLKMRRAAGWALASLALHRLDENVVPRVDELLDDPDENIRLWACMLAAERTSDAEPGEPPLHRFLGSADANERFQAAEAIWRIDERHRELAVHILHEIVAHEDRDPEVQRRGERLLGDIFSKKIDPASAAAAGGHIGKR